MFLGFYAYTETAPFLKQYHNFNRSSIFASHAAGRTGRNGLMFQHQEILACGCPPSPFLPGCGESGL